MKSLLSLVLCFAVSILVAQPADFRDRLGLQLWSLRALTKEDPLKALDQAKSYGITMVETAGTGGLPVEQFAAELKARGLRAVSAHVGYDTLKKNLEGAIRDAKILGVQYIVCPTMPRPAHGFDAEAAKSAAAEFNTWGETIRAAGLRFGYHPHGFEFVPTGGPDNELAIDILLRETKPELVCFEMDVFWVAHGGGDPAALLQKYPGRWELMHVKDMRRGAVTGLSTGRAAPTDNVAVGTGQIDWPTVIGAAQRTGVKFYFVEDETPAPLQCIPDSLAYLRKLKL